MRLDAGGSSMFFMKTKKRVKKLEDELKKFEAAIVSQDEKIEKLLKQTKRNKEDISSINFALNDLGNRINVSSDNSTNDISAELVNSKIKETVLRLTKYVDSNIEKISSEYISKEETENIISRENQKILSELRNHSSTSSERIDYDAINKMIVQTVQSYSNNDTRVNELERLLKSEQEKNTKLELTIQNLLVRIESLEKKEIKKPVENEYTQKYVSEIYTVDKKTEVNIINPSEPVKKDTTDVQSGETNRNVIRPLFSDNELKNEKALQLILNNAIELKQKYAEVTEIAEDAIYLKTVDMCISRMQKLIDKNNSSAMDASKLAGEVVKILNSTIVKNFSRKELVELIDQFMIKSSFVKKELEVGKKLTDEDYAYIGDMPLDIPVKSYEQHNVILEKQHDAYIIYVKDEEGISERIIDGKYGIGKFVK